MWDFRDVVNHLTPPDMAMLDIVWGKVCDDAVLYTLIFMFQEPTPILRFVELGQDLPQSYDAQALLDIVLKPLTKYMHGVVVKQEHENVDGHDCQISCDLKRGVHLRGVCASHWVNEAFMYTVVRGW